MKTVEKTVKIGEINKQRDKGKVYKIISYILSLTLLGLVLTKYIPMLKDLSSPKPVFTFAAYFTLILVVEVFIHEHCHWIGMKINKGQPKITWPKFYKYGLVNPQAYDTSGENKYFTRREYIICLLIPVFVGTLIAIPFYLFFKDFIWTLIYLCLVFNGAATDISEAIMLYKDYDRNILIKMQLGKVHGQVRCINVEIYRRAWSELRNEGIVKKVVSTGEITDKELSSTTNEELVELLTTLPSIIEHCGASQETLWKIKDYVLNKLNGSAK